METPEILRRYRAFVDQEMRAVLDAHHLSIYDMVRYQLGWLDAEGRPSEGGSGKGLRPALSLLTADALDGSAAARQRALAGAAAVEFVHNYSLVHDDIQDRDRERHHRPTVWAQWGDAQGINVGDALHELAQQALQRAAASGADPSIVLAAQAALSAAGLEMIEGQYLDLTFEARMDIAPDEYRDMILRKTGAMFGVSLQLGALLATGDTATAEHLRQAGRRLGLLFQIRDDHLGIWGDSTRTGKSSDTDIRRRKKTLPLVHAFTSAAPSERALLERIYAQSTLDTADVEAVLDVLASVDARSASVRAAQEQRAAFQDALDHCTLPPAARAPFLAVADFVLQREY